jgi:hypothetical protein
VTALLLLHLRQDGGNSVQNSLDVDVNLPIPFLHFERMDWRDGHNASVIHQDVDAAEPLDGSLDERFHFDALRDVDGTRTPYRWRPKSRLRLRLYGLSPRCQDDLRLVSRKKLGSAMSKSAAGSGDYYDFVCDI